MYMYVYCIYLEVESTLHVSIPRVMIL